MLVENKRGTVRNISENQLAEYVAKGYQPLKKKNEEPAKGNETTPDATSEGVKVTRRNSDK